MEAVVKDEPGAAELSKPFVTLSQKSPCGAKHPPHKEDHSKSAEVMALKVKTNRSKGT